LVQTIKNLVSLHVSGSEWQKSVRDIDKGVVKEYAAILVEGQEGEIKLVNPVEGTSDSVTPNLDIAEDEEFVGTFHTHPYEDGTTTAFSGQDIASALETQEKISGMVP
jgi:proteasome lid subunit RPN8/RPN11